MWRRLDDGDYLKFKAQSNLFPEKGGGARDLRFRNWDAFEPVFGEMFPGRAIGTKSPRRPEIFTGTLGWDEGGTTRTAPAEIWPETDARPNEGRLARVYQYPPFSSAQRFPGEIELVVLVQDSDGEVWPYIIGHTQLQDWDASIATPILECLFKADRREGSFAAGYIDLVEGRRECVV